MITVANPAAYLAAATARQRTAKYVQMDIANFDGSTSLTQSDIRDLEVYEGVNSDEEITVGSFCASRLTVKIRKSTAGLPTLFGSRVTVRHGLDVDGEIVYVPLGTFWVTGIEWIDSASGGWYEVTAYDAFIKWENDIFVTELDCEAQAETSDPITLNDLLYEIWNQIGATLDFDYKAYQTRTSQVIVKETPIGYSYREMLGYIAGCIGCYCRFGRNGKLHFAWYENSGLTIDVPQHHQSGLKIRGNYTVNATIRAYVDSKNSKAKPVYGYTNPFIQSYNLAVVQSFMPSVVYAPVSVKWRGDPRIEAGDFVSVKSQDGKIYSMPVMTQTISINGGLCMNSQSSDPGCSIDEFYSG